MMRAALARCAARGHGVSTIIDVGASDGRWTVLAREFFPRAQAILIEAQPAHESALRQLAQTNAGVRIVMAAASDREGVIHFDASDPFGGVASQESVGAGDILVPARTIDGVIAQTCAPGPYLIKLDTHGYERAILCGAAATLERAELLIIEAYTRRLPPHEASCPLFYELCAELSERGFDCVDLCDVSRGAAGYRLSQLDLVFARRA